jgi:glycosyltransferase involved in cell wall biosynthesis
MKKILIVGQTPPPYTGQAIMIEHLKNACYKMIKIYHVRMNFAGGKIENMGKFQFSKILHLLFIIIQIYYIRLLKKVDILYFPPSGPTNSVFRDMAILFSTRFMFKKTIFHFHASGLSEHLKRKGRIFNYILKKSFMYPDIAIYMSESCSNEGLLFNAKKSVIVPYGIPDMAGKYKIISEKEKLNILFVGVLEETKGEMDILRAAAILKLQGIEFKVKIAGDFKRPDYRDNFFSFIKQHDLQKNIEYLGIITGEDKKNHFKDADIFCFPSYYHSEAFPVVLIEAMSFGLPIISTYWRGIPDMVDDGYNGFLINIKSPEEIADKIVKLKNNIGLMKQMSINGRQTFEQKYSLTQHLLQIESVFESV